MTNVLYYVAHRCQDIPIHSLQSDPERSYSRAYFVQYAGCTVISEAPQRGIIHPFPILIHLTWRRQKPRLPQLVQPNYSRTPSPCRSLPLPASSSVAAAAAASPHFLHLPGIGRPHGRRCRRPLTLPAAAAAEEAAKHTTHAAPCLGTAVTTNKKFPASAVSLRSQQRDVSCNIP